MATLTYMRHNRTQAQIGELVRDRPAWAAAECLRGPQSSAWRSRLRPSAAGASSSPDWSRIRTGLGREDSHAPPGLSRELAARGARAEPFLVGGAALAACYDMTRATRDLDAVRSPGGD